MSEIAAKMRESVNEELEPETQPELEKEVELTENEVQAKDMGWRPEGKDRDDNSLSADEFLARKPLFNKINNQSKELSEIRELLHDLKADNRKITEAGIKEKETLLAQLKDAKEEHLTNLDVDEVRKIDKQIESVQEEIKSTPEKVVSPHFESFKKDNAWAEDEDSPLSMAAEGMARRYLKSHQGASDKEMYQHIHDQVRKDFPEKFQEKPRVDKVASSKSRSTNSYAKKQAVTLSDLSAEDQKVVSVMAERTGKTVDEYLKNDTLDDWRQK